MSVILPSLELVNAACLPPPLTIEDFLLATKGTTPPSALPSEQQAKLAALECLDFAGAALQDTELATIVLFIRQHCTQLKTLDLSKTTGLTLEAIHSLATITTLQKLLLDQSSITACIQAEENSAVTTFCASIKPRLFASLSTLQRHLSILPPPLDILEKILNLSTRVRRAASNLDNTPVKLAESIRIARLAINVLAEIPVSDTQVQRLSKDETGLSHTLFYNPSLQIVYLTAPYKNPAEKREGSFKKVTSAVGIALQTDSIYPIVRSYTKKGLSETNFKANLGDVALVEPLRGLPGVVQMHACVIHPSKFAPYQRMSTLMEKLETDTFDAIMARKLTPLHKFQLMKGAIYGLFSFHEAGYYHGDIKIENIFLKFTEETKQKPSQCVAKVGDFGTSRPVAELPSKGNNNYKKGFYGTLIATSPELLGIANFVGDPRKIDAFALGCALFTLFEEDMVPWKAHVDSMYDFFVNKTHDLTSRPLKTVEVTRTIDQTIEKVAACDAKIPALKTKVKNGEALSRDEIKECGQWIYKNLLTVDPEKRFNLSQAKAEIDELFPDFQVA